MVGRHAAESSNRRIGRLAVRMSRVWLALGWWAGPTLAGVGMTMPVTPPAETCNLNIPSNPGVPFVVPSLLSNLLPAGGYELAPEGFLDETPPSFVSGPCSTNWQACPAAGPTPGNVNEQDGRLNSFLIFNAATQDSKFILLSAVWTALGQSIPGAPGITTCGGLAVACAKHLAELAVTGRQAYNSFISWDPLFGPATSGPQPADLLQLLQTTYSGASSPPVPPIGSVKAFTNLQLKSAVNMVLLQAYRALYAIRSNLPAWRQFRAGSHAWLAVSGEKDTPHRPVNVPTAPYPQYDIAVPMTVNGQAVTLTTRYMLAASRTFIELQSNKRVCVGCPALPTTTPAPAIPIVRAQLPICPINPPKPLPQRSCFVNRWSLPVDSLGTPPPLTDQSQYSYIIYIHGGGSRLEEADALAAQLTAQSGSHKLIVISFDLPNSAYADQWLRSPSSAPTFLDADTLFEDNPTGNVFNFPLLAFTMQFVTSFIFELGQQNVINPNRVIAVVGGSLGGNISLLLAMSGQPSATAAFAPGLVSSPTNSANSPIVHPLPPSANIVVWSPTAMVSYIDNAGLIAGNNLKSSSPQWQSEVPGTRSAYFYHVYYHDTATFPGFLPPDPEMWYRSDWADSNNVNDCEASFIAQSRFDRYEVYSSAMRRWTTAIDTEQAIFSFQTNTDRSNDTYAPNYGFIGGRVLLLTGACDDYDNDISQPNVVQPTLSTGICNNQVLGNTGRNLATHQDIYGFTHDVANDMQAATGKAAFINDTGHSIHDERPAFLADQILGFLFGGDNNISVSLITDTAQGGDLRENSEVHVIVSQLTPGQSPAVPVWSLDIPLNYWFHPWPAGPFAIAGKVNPAGSLNNPCGPDCTKLVAFRLKNDSVHNFTIALPSGVDPTTANSFQIEFISDWNISQPGTIGYGNDNWVLGGIAACQPGGSGSFITDGSTTIPRRQPTRAAELSGEQLRFTRHPLATAIVHGNRNTRVADN